MSHRRFSELTKDVSPEHRANIEAGKARIREEVKREKAANRERREAARCDAGAPAGGAEREGLTRHRKCLPIRKLSAHAPSVTSCSTACKDATPLRWRRPPPPRWYGERVDAVESATERRHGRKSSQTPTWRTSQTERWQEDHLPQANVRWTRVKAAADAGAVMPALPEDVVERPGVSVAGRVAGPMTAHIGDRSMRTNCIVEPAGAPPLLDRVILTQLDLAADCVKQTLGPRPESPDRPQVRLPDNAAS